MTLNKYHFQPIRELPISTTLSSIGLLLTLALNLTGCGLQSRDDPRAYPYTTKVLREFGEFDYPVITATINGEPGTLLCGFKHAERYRFQFINMQGATRHEVTLWENVGRKPVQDTTVARWRGTIQQAERFLGFYTLMNSHGVKLFCYDPSSRDAPTREVYDFQIPPDRVLRNGWQIAGPMFLPFHSSSQKLPLYYLEYSQEARHGPKGVILLDSIEPWRERFRIEGGLILLPSDALDIDGDGELEILFGSQSSAQARNYNGLDNRCGYIAAYRQDGTVVWQRSLDSGATYSNQIVLRKDRNRLLAWQSVAAFNDEAPYTLIIEIEPRTGAALSQWVYPGLAQLKTKSDGSGVFFLGINKLSGEVQKFDITGKIEKSVQLQTVPTEINKLKYPYDLDDTTKVLYCIGSTNNNFNLVTEDLEVLCVTQDISGFHEYATHDEEARKRTLRIIEAGDSCLAYIESGVNPNSYHLVTIKKNHLWWFWRFRWYFNVFGIISGVVVGGVYFRKFWKKRAEHAMAQAQIRLLSRELITAQERERWRISRDLHDTIAQELAGIKAQLESQASEPFTHARVRALSDQLQHSIQGVRDISHYLLPAGFEAIGIIRATRAYAEEFCLKNALDLTYTATGIDESCYGYDLKITLFRVVQEALTNIAKHAAATSVNIQFVDSGSELILRIADNGRGFHVEDRTKQLVAEKRIGLLGMRERVQLLGGSFHAQSEPGKGTRITVKMPIGL